MAHTALTVARRDDRPAPDQPGALPAWYRHPWARFVAFPGVLIACSALNALLLDGAPHWLWPPMQLLACAVAYLVLACWLELRLPPVELHWRRAGGLLAGMALGGGVMLAVFGICWAAGWRTVSGIDHAAPLLLPLFHMGVIAGIGEELIFRGWLFRSAELALGTWGATVASAVVFGAVHLTNPGGTLWGATAIALEAGVMFALLYAVTRSLWVTMGVHGAWNVVQGPVLGSAVSGATRNGEGWVVSHPAGPELLSGGAFGLEASLVAVVLWLAISAWLAREARRRGHLVDPVWVRHRRGRAAAPPPADDHTR